MSSLPQSPMCQVRRRPLDNGLHETEEAAGKMSPNRPAIADAWSTKNSRRGKTIDSKYRYYNEIQSNY
jgi:hypothetical protein